MVQTSANFIPTGELANALAAPSVSSTFPGSPERVGHELSGMPGRQSLGLIGAGADRLGYPELSRASLRTGNETGITVKAVEPVPERSEQKGQPNAVHFVSVDPKGVAERTSEALPAPGSDKYTFSIGDLVSQGLSSLNLSRLSLGKYGLGLLAGAAFTMQAEAGTNTVMLAWDRNTDSPSGYRLYVGPNPYNYTKIYTITGFTNTSVRLTGMDAGNYTAVLTAYIGTPTKVQLESEFSNTVDFRLPFVTPPNQPPNPNPRGGETNVVTISYNSATNLPPSTEPSWLRIEADPANGLVQIITSMPPLRNGVLERSFDVANPNAWEAVEIYGQQPVRHFRIHVTPIDAYPNASYRIRHF